MSKPEFYRTETGVGYIKLTWLDLVRYSGMMAPICDFCASALSAVPLRVTKTKFL